MKKILMSEWVPEKCLAPYKEDYDFTCPSREKHAFSYDEIYEMIEDYDAYFILDNEGDKKVIDRAKNLKVCLLYTAFRHWDASIRQQARMHSSQPYT